MRNGAGLAAASVFALGACGGPENEIITKFFVAVKANDNATVASMSVVGFAEEMDSWQIEQVVANRSEPFKLPELRSKMEEARKARDEQYSQFSLFRVDNYDDLKFIEERLKKDPQPAFRGKLAELYATWEKYRDERKQLEGRLKDIERAINQERQMANMSLMTSANLDEFDGEVLVREVQVKVKAKEAEKPYLFTLRRYSLANPKNNFRPPSRWIITDLQEKAGEAS